MSAISPVLSTPTTTLTPMTLDPRPAAPCTAQAAQLTPRHAPLSRPNPKPLSGLTPLPLFTHSTATPHSLTPHSAPASLFTPHSSLIALSLPTPHSAPASLHCHPSLTPHSSLLTHSSLTPHSAPASLHHCHSPPHPAQAPAPTTTHESCVPYMSHHATLYYYA